MNLEKEHARGRQVLNKMNARLRQLEEQVHEFELQHMQQTQVNLFSSKFIFLLSKIHWRSLNLLGAI
jgi:CII-binding regulator of phage lambda lysogenization HflD